MYFHVRFQNALKINKRPIFFPKGFYCSQNPVKFRWKHFKYTAKASKLLQKGPVKLMQQVIIAHIFTVCVRSVPLYLFKLAYVVLHLDVKQFFETDF